MFKRKNFQNSVRAGALAVATAMAGMGTAGLSTSASAVSIAHDGLGETLIFPYYSARNGFATFFNIINTSDKTVILKVRWNEGENSRDARDFNVILSPKDVWSVATAGSANDNARALTGDNSCTSPQLPTVGTNSAGETITGIDFTNVAYTGSNDDTGTQGLSRTREGYFTVFEMGVVDPTIAGLTPTQIALANRVIASAEHSNVGNNQGIPGAGDTELPNTPTNCNYIDTLFSSAANTALLAEVVSEPINALKGRAVLIELSTGVAHGYDPVTLENFFTPTGVDGASPLDILAQPALSTPNLGSVNPALSVSVRAGAPVINGPFTNAVDAVTDLLSRSSIINDYNITSGSQTDWVITFPTKGFYVDRANVKPGVTAGPFFKLAAGATPLPPFSTAGGEVFADPDIIQPLDGRGDIANSTGESCLPIAISIWDREEFQRTNATTGFSPVPPGGAGAELCKEANILSFGDSNIFDSQLRSSLFGGASLGSIPGLNGWAEISFTGVGSILPGAGTATIGLPVTGMRLEARQNSKFAGKSFGFSSDHAYK